MTLVFRPRLVRRFPAYEAHVAEKANGPVTFGRVWLMEEASFRHLCRQSPLVVHVRPASKSLPSGSLTGHGM